MSLSLRKLLQNPSLHLRIVTTGVSDAQSESDSLNHALDQEFEWLHATDMIDPTPFLGPAEVILTLGWQFPITHPVESSRAAARTPLSELNEIYDAYAALVASHGVIGIGFGSDVVHRGVPRQLQEACEKHGLVLFDVPYEISFMDLLQEAARVLQRDQTERYTRSLRAQRAIASAATRRDGLTATLRETSRQLGCGVALFDPLGRPVTVVDAPGGRKVNTTFLAPLVEHSLATGLRFHTTSPEAGVEAVLQLLGDPENPSGVLTLTLSQGFDDLSRNVLSSVLALVSVSLEQNQALTALHSTLREALLQLILAEHIDVTRPIIESVWGQLPQPPLTALVALPIHHDASLHIPALDALRVEADLTIFFAEWQGNIALLLPERESERLLGLLEGWDFVIGRARCDHWSGAPLALEQALRAAEFGKRRNAETATLFSDIWSEGLSDLIDPAEAAHVSSRLLKPLLEQDQSQNNNLVETLRVWLSHHGRQLPAARQLDIHRHTLAHRLELISNLTGLDLDHADSRVELSLALRYLRTT